MAVDNSTQATSVLKTMLDGMTKTYMILDGSNRMTFAYTAAFDAVHGQICLRTEYRYAGPASTIIIGRKETPFVWDSAWDATAGFTT